MLSPIYFWLFYNAYYIEGYLLSKKKKVVAKKYYFCHCISLSIYLILTSILQYCRELRVRKPLQLLVNFCIALALLLITFIASGERSNLSLNWQCQTGAIFLHYFTLVVFFSMALIGFDFYLKFVKTVKDSTPHFLLKYLSVGWGKL